MSQVTQIIGVKVMYYDRYYDRCWRRHDCYDRYYDRCYDYHYRDRYWDYYRYDPYYYRYR